MATWLKGRARDLYEQDIYAWSKEQAALLRARRFEDLDLEHLVEEIEDVGGNLKRSVRSRIRTIIVHLLKLQHSPQEPRGGWYDTIIAQRSDLADELAPSIRREVEPELPSVYERARNDAAMSLRKHGERAAADTLPETYPYSLDRITCGWLP